ncbi:MAG: hypothetical protein F4Y04_03855 [Chloroflexi bacterium]|nr:hypothetical protein [Chloroflexota bacterium]
MDFMGIAQQLMVAGTLAAIGWVIRSLRDLGTRLSDHQSRNDERLDKVEQRLVKAEELERHSVIERLADAERQLAASVTTGQLARLHERVDEMHRDNAALTGKIGEISGEVKAVRGSLQAIEGHLISKGE